jgi:hypothetical protein
MAFRLRSVNSLAKYRHLKQVIFLLFPHNTRQRALKKLCWKMVKNLTKTISLDFQYNVISFNVIEVVQNILQLHCRNLFEFKKFLWKFRAAWCSLLILFFFWNNPSFSNEYVGLFFFPIRIKKNTWNSKSNTVCCSWFFFNCFWMSNGYPLKIKIFPQDT